MNGMESKLFTTVHPPTAYGSYYFVCRLSPFSEHKNGKILLMRCRALRRGSEARLQSLRRCCAKV